MRNVLATVLVIAGGWMFLGVNTARGEDKIIGAIWEVRVKMPGTDKYVSKGLTRCTRDGKVYADGKVVGNHKMTSLETVEINITNGPGPRSNGKTKASRVTKDGSVWEGVHENAQGESIPVRLFLKKD